MMPASTSTSTSTASDPVSSAATHTPQLQRQLAGSRRDRDDAGSDGEQEPSPRRKRTRRVKDTEDSVLTSVGAAMGLMGDLFRDFEAILNAGLGASEHSPDSALSYRERKYIDLYYQLLSIAPWILDEIVKRGPKGTMDVAHQLEAGRSGVRSVDLYGIKHAVVTWEPFNPPIAPDAKSVRGFNHLQCGRYLIPEGLDWSDPEVRAGLQNRSRKYPVTGKDFNKGLWEGGTAVDPDNLSTGFLRHEHLTKAARFVLLGPRAANNLGKIAARKPKAKIYRIRSITVPFIAYCAVLVHFSLSSQETFGDGSTPGTFPYEEYYQSIVRYAEETMTEDERTDLLIWWNLQVFGQLDDDEDEEDDNSSGDQPKSVLARMKAQAAARARAASSSS